jgi:hypothetical protein
MQRWCWFATGGLGRGNAGVGAAGGLGRTAAPDAVGPSAPTGDHPWGFL